MGKQTIESKVVQYVDKKELVRLAGDLVDIPSPSGREIKVAEYILNWFETRGFQTVKQQVSDQRANAVAIWPGSGGGASLMFNGHMDVVFTGLSDQQLLMGMTEPGPWPKAVFEGGLVSGPGIGNDKAAISAFMIATQALLRAGVKLKGDLILAAVFGEIERAPIDLYQGQDYCGMGSGTTFLLAHGITSDYVLVAEPSGFSITWALTGGAYVKLSTFGEPVYSPYLQSYQRWQESQNAIVKMLKVLEAVEAWGQRYERENQYIFSAGTIVPKVNIGALLGGLPFKPNYAAAECHAYLDVRTPPGKDPGQIKEALREVIDPLGIPVEILLYRSQRGYEGKASAPVVEAVTAACHQVTKGEPKKLRPPFTSTWNDLNIYHEKGIPGAKFGPSIARPSEAERRAGRLEAVNMDELVSLAKIYALTALDICNRDKPSADDGGEPL